jgi:hypothetical protein
MPHNAVGGDVARDERRCTPRVRGDLRLITGDADASRDDPPQEGQDYAPIQARNDNDAFCNAGFTLLAW